MTLSVADFKKRLLERGILVHSHFLRKTFVKRIDWPHPASIKRNADGVGNHLEMGITLEAAQDFLDSTGFPADYERSASMQNQNGPLRRQRDVNGYDLVKHIRFAFQVLGYEQASVVEVLHAAGHPSVGVGELPKFFLSHAQQESWITTKKGIKRACNDALPWRAWLLGCLLNSPGSRSCPVWVDYFCLRQCRNDFDKAKIRALIKKIRYTVMLLDCGTLGKPVVFTRIFCIFEVACTVEEGARLCGVLNSRQALCVFMGQWWRPGDIVGCAKGSNAEHVKAILESVAKNKLNKMIVCVMRQFAACTFEQCILWFVVPAVCYTEGLAAFQGLQMGMHAESICAAMTGIAACVGAVVSVPIFQRLVRRSDATAGVSQMVGHACVEICCWHGSATFARFLAYFIFWRFDDLMDAISDFGVLAMLIVIVILCSQGYFKGSSGDIITTVSFVIGGLALCGAVLDFVCYLLQDPGPSKDNNRRLTILYGVAGLVLSLLGLFCKLLQLLHRRRSGTAGSSAGSSSAFTQSEQSPESRPDLDDVERVARNSSEWPADLHGGMRSETLLGEHCDPPLPCHRNGFGE